MLTNPNPTSTASAIAEPVVICTQKDPKAPTEELSLLWSPAGFFIRDCFTTSTHPMQADDFTGIFQRPAMMASFLLEQGYQPRSGGEWVHQIEGWVITPDFSRFTNLAAN